MKWYSHKAVGAGASLVLGLPLSGILITTLSSVLPDAVEFGVLKHRGLSHAWWIYGLLYMASVIAFPGYSIYFFCAALGILLHILCDAMTMTGVPAIPFSEKRIAFKFFKTGSFTEYVVVVMVVFACFYLFTKTGDVDLIKNDPFLKDIKLIASKITK
ncbi:MAG: metal-dependent hydrolase [Nitrospirae bacterium]|jgi:inner membrane protein|nr:metal-dependent hydrolase [Nitrospirota bacterium]